MKLSKPIIDSLRYEGTENTAAQCIFWDDEVKGLGVRINPKGTKTFVLSYRVGGRKRILKIGRYGPLTLDDARKRSKKALAAAIDGIDALGSKAEEVRGKTVKHLYTDYIERHAKVHKKTWKKDVQRLERNVIPEIGCRLVTSITPYDIEQIHREMTSRGAEYEANRTIEVIRKMFKLARVWGYGQVSGSALVEGIVRNREKKRDVFVSHEQMPKLVEAINAEKNIYVRVALWLGLLTGMRKSEILSAKWEYLDRKAKELRLPETKNGKPHYVPLSDEALEWLNKLPRKLDNPYIFPAENGSHRVCIKKNWERVRVAAKLPNLRIHDLRRTVGSWLAQEGNSLHLIGTVLNHHSTQTTAVYARFTRQNERKALEEHAKRLMSVTAPKADSAEKEAS